MNHFKPVIRGGALWPADSECNPKIVDEKLCVIFNVLRTNLPRPFYKIIKIVLQVDKCTYIFAHTISFNTMICFIIESPKESAVYNPPPHLLK
jgi:hypothetical protein